MHNPCSQHDSERALELKALLAPHFMTLRRLLAQLGGLVLLARGRRSETWDGVAVSLVVLKVDLAEAQDGLAAAARQVGDVAPSLQHMQNSADDVAKAIALLEHQGLPRRLPGGNEKPDHGPALALLQRAQRHLHVIADERSGFTMIAFSHACCCVPHTTARQCV